MWIINSQEFCSTPRCNLETSFFSEVTPFTSEEGPHLAWEKSNILISSWNQENLWETEGCSGWRDRPGLLVKWQREIRSLFLSREHFTHFTTHPITTCLTFHLFVRWFQCHIIFTNHNEGFWLKSRTRSSSSLSFCVFSPSQLAAYLFGLLEQVNLELLLVHHYCCCSTWTQRCPLIVPRLTHVYTTHCSHCDNIHFLHLTYFAEQDFFIIGDLTVFMHPYLPVCVWDCLKEDSTSGAAFCHVLETRIHVFHFSSATVIPAWLDIGSRGCYWVLNYWEFEVYARICLLQGWQVRTGSSVSSVVHAPRLVRTGGQVVVGQVQVDQIQNKTGFIGFFQRRLSKQTSINWTNN